MVENEVSLKCLLQYIYVARRYDAYRLHPSRVSPTSHIMTYHLSFITSGRIMLYYNQDMKAMILISEKRYERSSDDSQIYNNNIQII